MACTPKLLEVSSPLCGSKYVLGRGGRLQTLPMDKTCNYLKGRHLRSGKMTFARDNSCLSAGGRGTLMAIIR